MMATLTADTHKIALILSKSGFSKEQTNGFLEAIKEVDMSHISTKDDTLSIKQELEVFRTEVKADTATLKSEIFRFIIITAGVQIAMTGLMLTLFKLGL